MNILYYDCFSGISGDMNLGALIDIGVDKEYLIKELLKLNIDGYNIEIKKDIKKGISGTKVDVILETHNHETKSDDHNNHHHHHHHRNLNDIEDIIHSSDLNDNVKDISLKIFKKVAEAEAKVHNKSLEEVHFHEVGAVDSIVDIVGAAICLDYLNIHKVKCSTVEVGSGFVKCAHGVLPVPAPATTEILTGIPIKSNIPFEATTPTGAAILAYLVDEFTDSKNFKISKVGYGIGNKDAGETPNILRLFIAEEVVDDKVKYIEEAAIDDNNDEGYLKDEVQVIECNIDDMNSELYDYVMQLLFREGALDVYLIPIIMKKGRPGVKLNILCKLQDVEKIKKVVLTETTTLGVRMYKAQRDMLRRDLTKITTSLGEFTVKNAYYNGKKIKCKPEYDECKKAALEKNISINEVYKEIFSNM